MASTAHRYDPRLVRAVSKMARIAEQIGLTPDDLIMLLKSGMTVQQLIDYVFDRAAGRAVEN